MTNHMATTRARFLEYQNWLSLIDKFSVGLILRLPFWNRPHGEQIYDDEDFWEIPDDGFPEVREIWTTYVMPA